MSHTAKPVDANYRYIAAANELNTRIGQRQQLLAIYVSLVLGLVAGLVALRPEAGEARVPVNWLLLGFPVASVCLVLLNYKTERALTQLRSFLAALERIGQDEHGLPGYNTDPAWSLAANDARRFHDYSAALLVAATNALGLGALWRMYPGHVGWDAVVVWINALTALASVVALLWLPRWAYQPIKPVAPDSDHQR